MDPFCYLCFVFVLSYCVVCFMQPCGHLLEKGRSFGFLARDVFLSLCHFSIWCPGSGVVFDCIDS